MATLVSTLTSRPVGPERILTEQQRRAAARKLRRRTAANPLRRVLLTCHGWVRDPSAVVGDWLFCEHADCGDLRRVIEVAE